MKKALTLAGLLLLILMAWPVARPARTSWWAPHGGRQTQPGFGWDCAWGHRAVTFVISLFTRSVEMYEGTTTALVQLRFPSSGSASSLGGRRPWNRPKEIAKVAPPVALGCAPGRAAAAVRSGVSEERAQFRDACRIQRSA